MRDIYFIEFGITTKTGMWFYSVTKLKETNISHLLTLAIKRFPT
jgi:hypothetical protein